MEQSKSNHTDKRKRLHHHSHSDSDSDSDESQSLKHPRVDSVEFGHLARVDPVLDPELLNMLNDAENATERDSIVLDSVIKSFEEEILAPAPNPKPSPEAQMFKPYLGYLLEASDDELGLPPTVAASEESSKAETTDSCRVGVDGVDLTGFLGFEDDIGNYDGFGLMGYDVEDNGGGYVTIDGLFDYAEAGADILWRSESLQAM